MGDMEMTMSQAEYQRLDDSYSAEFWSEVSQRERQPRPTQESTGTDTAVNSASTSLNSIGSSATLFPTTPKKASTVPFGSQSVPAKSLQINRSPSKSPSKPSMVGPRSAGKLVPALTGTASGVRPVTGCKRLSTERSLPPSKFAKLEHGPIPTRASISSSNKPASAPAGKKPTEPKDRFTLDCMFGGHHGQHLEPYVICHSTEVQPALDRLQIARGVQWELVRGVMNGAWTWEDVESKIDQLKGTNEVIAPAVGHIMLGKVSRQVNEHEKALWRELDREAKATVENRGRGLGLMGEFEGVPDYYGGNIQCRVSLLHAGDGEEPKLRLEPLEMTRSTHLARELGSVSVIALRDNKKGQLVKQYARRKFILCGRSYVALPPKDNKVYLIETNEDHDRVAQEWCGDQHRISYDEFLRRNNPLKHNANQPFAKYLTRINLYLSTSVPVLEFGMEGIELIDDSYAAGLTRATAQTEQIMTDGCGFINRAAALKINAKLQYERLPVAFQGRIAGSKGVWILHPSDDSPIPRIWIRYSQKKITLNRPNNLARGHRIFELLAVSKASSSAHLSAQSLIILSHNGVPSEVFTALQKDGLENLIQPLMDWRRPNATAYLWNAVNEVSNVTRSRLQRLAVSASRALGFEKRRFEELELAEDSDMVDFEIEDTTHTGRNSWSGEPMALSEATMDLLQAGFDPLKLPLLSSKIHNVIKTTIETFLSKYKIPLATSFEAYMVPDPSGLLQEGQVFFKSSLDPDGPLREEVVLGRYPMREPSDMQKVMAVDIPDLGQYVDVLVIPIQGSRSLASLLAGGDTDADEVIIIRDPDIVGPFQNRVFVPPQADFLSTNFKRQVQTVTEFGRKLQGLDAKIAQPLFQEELLVGLSDAKVGIYSMYHDVAAWEWGLDDPRTRRIAQMTATLLDASKTGLRLKASVEQDDQRLFNRIPRPHCFDTKGGIKKRRNLKLGPFVLDSLLTVGNSQKDQLLQQFENTIAIHLGVRENRPDLESHIDLDDPPDPDIEGPYLRLSNITQADNPSIAADLEAIRVHIHPLLAKYDSCMKDYAKAKDIKAQPQPNQKQRQTAGISKAENDLLSVIRDFRQPVENLKILHLVADVDEIKASRAFYLSQKFSFSMAFRDICELKRKAELKRGPFNKVAIIDDAKSMAAPARRLLKHMGEEK